MAVAPYRLASYLALASALWGCGDSKEMEAVSVVAKAIEPQPIPADCKSEQLPAQLEVAKARWRSRGIVDYRYTAERHAMFYSSSWPESAPIVISVRGGRATGGPPEMSDAELQWLTVEGQFKSIEDAIAEPPDCLRVTFDKVFGFPAEIYVDPNWSITDDHQILVFRDFSA